VKRAIAATPSGGNEFGELLKECAEKNITMTQEYLKDLSQARNFQDMVRIQTEFMQSLMNAAGEQTRSLAEACTKTAADAAKKPVSGMS
jgi:phasin family protein